MIAVRSHARRAYCRFFVGWFAVVAYAVSLPGLSVGLANAALGLLDAHQVEISTARGNDVMIVLHHAEPHTHARGETPRSAGRAASAEGAGAGATHDEDHVLFVPGAQDSSTRTSHDEARAALASPVTLALAAAWGWHRGAEGDLVSPLAWGAQPRAGPTVGRRVTELRI